MKISYALALALMNPKDHADQDRIGLRLWNIDRKIKRKRGQ
jgi:hypothetical protein